MNLLAIDPGNIESGFCIVDVDTLRPLRFGKLENKKLVSIVLEHEGFCAVETFASMGMAVGQTVFDACEWAGRFKATHEYITGREAIPVYRKEEKLHICGDSRAKDSNIRIALISRFAKTESGKGTKKEPDWFYGFAKDVWSAYAVAVTAIETQMKGENNACLRRTVDA